MSFTPNIPAINQSLGNSRLEVLNNFAVLRSTIAANHYDVNDTLAGKHKYSVMPVQGSGPTTTSTEGALYTKTDSGAQLYYKRGTDPEVKMTANWTPVAGTAGSTFLPGGIVMQWGTVSTSGSTTPVVFPTPFTALYNIQLTLLGLVTNIEKVQVVTTPAPSATGFSLKSSVIGTYDVYWMAIGNKT